LNPPKPYPPIPSLQIDLTKFGNQSDNIRSLIAGERYNE
jgi:hypothetical protein